VTQQPHDPAQYPAGPPGRKAALYLGGGALALLLVCCGGLAVIGAFSDGPQRTEPASGAAAPGAAAPGATVPADPALGTEPAAVAEVPATTAPSTAAPPAVTTRTVTEREAIPYRTRTVNDSTMAKGTKKTRTKGVAGVRTLTYEVTYTEGVETGRQLIKREVTRQPVTKVVLPHPLSDCGRSRLCAEIAQKLVDA
jgi:hypothetical protein